MESTGARYSRSKIDLEELLKAAVSTEETGDKVEVSTSNTPLSFVMAYNLVPGEHKVTVKLLYGLYKSWTKDPITKRSFSDGIAKYLVIYKGYVEIDRSSFKVSETIEKHLVKHTRPVTKSKSWKKHFENYLKKYSIVPGTYYIESYVLYHLYDKWTYGIKKKAPLGHVQFISMCHLYFKSKRNSSSRKTWFGVSSKSLFQVITVQQLVNIRNGRKKRYDRKKQSKKPKEVSSN